MCRGLFDLEDVFSEMLARNVTQKQLHNPLKTNPQTALFKDPVRTAL